MCFVESPGRVAGETNPAWKYFGDGVTPVMMKSTQQSIWLKVGTQQVEVIEKDKYIVLPIELCFPYAQTTNRLFKNSVSFNCNMYLPLLPLLHSNCPHTRLLTMKVIFTLGSLEMCLARPLYICCQNLCVPNAQSPLGYLL